MKKLIEFELKDKSVVLVEAEGELPEENEDSDIQRRSISPGQVAEVAKKTFEEAFDTVQSATTVIVDKLKGLAADEVEVKFGLKLTSNAGAIFTTVGSEVNFEVTLKWTK
jgi:Trypsin-co-occurring domain 1